MERARISVQKGRFSARNDQQDAQRRFFVFVHVTWPATAAPLDEVEPVTEKRIGGLR